MMKNIKVALFDLGNTLLYFDADFNEIVSQSFQVLARHLVSGGIPIDPLQFTRLFEERMTQNQVDRDVDLVENSAESLLQNLLIELGIPFAPDGLLRHALNAMFAVTEAHWILEPDAVETLEKLQHTSVRLGIITNAMDSNDVNILIDQNDLRRHFEQIVISGDEGIRKPHPEIFQKALDFFNVEPSRAVMVGDTLQADILGANKMGIHSLWITRRVQTPDRMLMNSSIEPTLTVGSLSEIPGLILPRV